MTATLSVGAFIFALMHVDGEPQLFDVAELFHEIPMESMDVCRQALREDSNQMVETIEEVLRAYWEPYMQDGEELVVYSGASCSPD